MKIKLRFLSGLFFFFSLIVMANFAAGQQKHIYNCDTGLGQPGPFEPSGFELALGVNIHQLKRGL